MARGLRATGASNRVVHGVDGAEGKASSNEALRPLRRVWSDYAGHTRCVVRLGLDEETTR